MTQEKVIYFLILTAFVVGAEDKIHCPSPPCLRKCCPATEIWDYVKGTCKSAADDYRFSVPSPEGNFSDPSLIVGRSCPHGSRLVPQRNQPVNFTFSATDEEVIVDGRRLTAEEYCIDDVESDGQLGRVLFVCTFHIEEDKDIEDFATLERIPLKKCCAHNSAYSMSTEECVLVNDTRWNPVIYNDANEPVEFHPEEFHITHENLTCAAGFISLNAGGFRLMQDGTVLLESGVRLPAGNFCAEVEEKSKLFIIKHCLQDPCLNNSAACLKKCCPKGYVGTASEGKLGCVESDIVFRPDFRDPRQPNTTLEVDADKYDVRYGIKPTCPESVGYNLLDPESYSEDTFFLLPNSGNLYVPAYAEPETGGYCVDNFDFNGKVSSHAIICFPAQPEDPAMDIILATYPIFLSISVFFLSITFLVYAVLPELHNLHGLTTMCLVFCMIVTYTGLAIIQTSSGSLHGGFCVSTAIVVQFFFLSIFTWLNVMSFDIWLTFSTSRPNEQSIDFWLGTLMPRRQSSEFPKPLEDDASLSRSVNYDEDEEDCRSNGNLRARTSSSYDRKKKRFLLYSLYAWSVPLIIVVVGQLMDNLPSVPSYIVKPGFGTLKCWFNDNWGLFYYFYGPIGVICVVNIIFFSMTARKLYLSGRDTAFATHNTNPKERFRVIIYLFVLTGVLWILEVVSFLVKGSPYIWMIPDIFNICTGIFIFVIFVCKPKVVQLLRKRIACFDNCCQGISRWKRSCLGARDPILPNRHSTAHEESKRKSSATMCTHVTNDSNSTCSADMPDRKWC